ncbi:pentatricopeptide repeat-containing protein At2g22070-like [Diospyros lotus]|uniref:pentatricopeptide repeat-containing protein At2g22070-like n=1 Tax=Diospyros lotus TaxID=55363 RepID=UPI002255AA85|nr:pentatricopeptide repeat-containing protein At2g22070-like [Diospyros lotus]
MRWSHAGSSCFHNHIVLRCSHFLPPVSFTRNAINPATFFQSHWPIHSFSSSPLHIDRPRPRLSNALAAPLNVLSAEIIHAKVIKNGSFQYLQQVNYILNLYVKSGNFGHARRLFDEIPQRDVQTWTVMISGFAHSGVPRLAFDLFRKMHEDGVFPNKFTFSSILKCCSSFVELRLGKAIHGRILRYGIDSDIALKNSLLHLYGKCAVFDYAERLFESMAEKDTVSWNIMIAAYSQIGDMEKSMDFFIRLPSKDVATWNVIIDGHIRNGFERLALNLLYEMVETVTIFNKVTFSIALVLAASLSILELGRQIHGRVLRIGTCNDNFVRNSLIDMYRKCGQMGKASAVFQNLGQDSTRIQISDVSCDESIAASVAWSSMVAGYIQNGRLDDAFKIFHTMVCRNIELDKFTLTSIISACGDAGLLELGQLIHAYVLKVGHGIDVFLCSTMIDMYAKCGRLDDAWSIFTLANVGNVVLWTAMISSCASHGQGKEAIWLFELMLNEGIKPNEVTFVGVLTACGHAGLFGEGCKYFTLMKEVYSITPSVEHFTCMIYLFGRSGRLNMIKDFIYENGVSHQSAVWKAFLSSCEVHKNIEMARWVSEKLLELEPVEPGPYVLLSNICASHHRWEEVANLRDLMRERGVWKQPGQSWI